MEWIVIFFYTLSLFLITLFSLGQLNLTIHYLRSKGKTKPAQILSHKPFVTIQLPVYNERYVIERLIEAICRIDYPLCKMEIQVLDDSSDETTEIIQHRIEKYQKVGFDIQHIRRPQRTGYKAGALQYGLERAKGEFIAIFDADFIPTPEFLLKTLPHFSEKTGMVQTRWDHINKDYSLLTKMQAFGLDAHFTIEQSGRSAAGSFINFNGTAGVWKKECIEDAGGWQYDTLTEDLDLSYRAQLKGWKFEYLEEVLSPAELPVVIPAIKSQQYRWNKGAAETARKNLKNVWLSPLKIKHKLRAIQHLMNSSVFFFLLVAALLSIPMLYYKEIHPQIRIIFDIGTIFITGFIAITIFYWVSSKASVKEKPFRYFSFNFPLFLAFSMGLALHNSVAILEGFTGKKTAFVRTPKFNITSRSDTWKSNKYLVRSFSFHTFLEGLLSLYFIFGIYLGLLFQDYGLIIFHAMMATGFGLVFYHTIRQNG